MGRSEIIELLKRKGPLTAKQIAEELKVEEYSVRNKISLIYCIKKTVTKDSKRLSLYYYDPGIVEVDELGEL